MFRRFSQKLRHPIVIFATVQLTWLLLVALWIHFYLSNHIIIKEVGDQISPELRPGSYHVLVLIFGCVLLILLQGGFYFLFIYLTRQMNEKRQQDHFIANITHELNSPIASIQLYLETLAARQVPEKRRQEFIQLMIRESNRLKATIDKILGTVIIDQKQLAFNFKVYNMRTIIPIILKDVLAKYQPDYTRAVQLDNSSECRCVLDKNAFRIIFINLFDNAIKYAGNHFSVMIHCYCDDQYFKLDFVDAGVGFPPGESKRIFRKFYRVYNAESPQRQGTGLGLYIVSEIIRSHGGRIRAESKGKNQGTTIHIELPIYKKTKKRFTNRLLKQTIKRKKRSENKIASRPGAIQSGQ